MQNEITKEIVLQIRFWTAIAKVHFTLIFGNSDKQLKFICVYGKI